MAFPKQKEINFLTILVTSWLLVAPVTATTNIDCRGKAFHCVNSTHFKICVDFGGVSKTVDDLLIPCPQSTVCTDNNYFECEYEITSAPVTTEQSDVTNQRFPVTTQTFWENFNVITTNNDEQRIDLSTSSTTTSRSQLAFTLPVTEKLKRSTYTSTRKVHEDIIRDSTEMLFNKTFNYTRESENNFKASLATSRGTTITYNKLFNVRLAADITYKTYANTERIEGIRTNLFKSIETSTPASTKYSERLLSNFDVNIPVDRMHRYVSEINITPISQIIGTPSTIFALPEAQSDISHFTGSTDSYIEKTSQNMKTSDFNITVTPTANDTPQNLLVSNKNIIESNNNGVTLALSENLISTTETNIETLYSLTTVNKPLSYVENETKILQNNNFSLPVITETSSTTNIDGENVLYTSISNLSTSTDLNTEYMEYSMQFGEINRPNMSTTSNEFYTGESKIASNNKINVTSLPARNLNKMNATLLAEVNETLILASESYNDNIPFMTTENKSFKNIEKDLTILQNKSIPDSVNMVFFKDVAMETPSSILNSTNLIHSYIDVTDQDTKLKDKNLPITLTLDVYEFYTEKDVVNKNNLGVSTFEKRARKNTIDVTTSSTLSENLISKLATNKNKKPISLALNISASKMPNKTTITKNNNMSSSVMPEYFTIKNFVTNEPSDISNITSIVNLHTENTAENIKVRDETFTITPITHIYDLMTNNIKMTTYNMTKDLSLNKNGTDVFANTTNIDFKTPVLYESKLLITNAVNENNNHTVKNLSPHKDIDLSASTMNNSEYIRTTKGQQITENILMDSLLYTTEPYVSNLEQSHKRDYTMNVHNSLNATENVTFSSTAINLLDSHDPPIINDKDIDHVEQKKNSYDSLREELHNNISVTKPSIHRNVINFDKISQKNENNSRFITNIFGILSHTTSTIDYTQSTEYNTSPTWNTVNNTVLDLLTRDYPLKNNVDNKYTAAKLESQRATKNSFLDSLNSTDLLKTEIESSTSITEVDTLGTSVTVGSLSTPPMQTRSRNIVQMLMPNLNNNPNVNDIERVLKTDRVNTTSVPKPAGIIGKHIYKNHSSIRSLPTSDSNELFKSQTINLFIYRSSNISLPEVEKATGYLATQSIKTDQDIISTNSFELPVTTERNSDKLTEKIDHFVTKSDSSHSTANFTLEYIGKTSPNIGSNNQSQTVTEKTEVMNMKEHISKTFEKLTNYTATESSNMNSDNLENISLNFFKHQESLTVSSNHDINKNITHSKLYSDAMIPQVFDKNKVFNETSKDSNSSRNINKLELLDYGQKVKDSLALNTQVESYSSFAITTSPLKSSENTDRLDKLKYLDIIKKREQNNRSNFNNETKLTAETYMDPGNYSINNLTSIPEVHNSSNYKIIKCRDKDTKEGCSKKGEDFTKLTRTNNNVTRTFERSPFVFYCDNRHRGKYSDKNDCESFYLCLGKGQPIFGKCPKNTVFSEILKQCTKNLSHCVRDNKFQCKSAGRYIDVISNQFYYICVKKGHRYIRFKLQCQKGYRLNSSKVKCVLDAQEESSSFEDSSNIERNRKILVSEPKEDINSKNKKKIFECLEEGKFTYPDHCSKYYECKRVKSEFQRKIKKCDSNEVFDDHKKKCVNDDSYECI